jgi:DNA-binding IclR family transcriptional regulator
MAGRGRDPGRSVTSRVLAVLAAFDDSHPRLRLSEVARRSGLPVSTVSRLLAELVAGEALARRPDGRYEVGRRLWQLGLLAPVNQELREVALPFIHDIQTATGDVVHIAVREGIAALYVERVVGRGSVAVVSRMGSRLPLHATGVGKVLLAEAPPEVLAEALANLTPVTRHTITDPARLLRDLAETRRRGVRAGGRGDNPRAGLGRRPDQARAGAAGGGPGRGDEGQPAQGQPAGGRYSGCRRGDMPGAAPRGRRAGLSRPSFH